MIIIHRRFQSVLTNVFKEGDLAIVRRLKNPRQLHLTKPLQKGVTLQTHNGDIPHEDIIGQTKRVYLQYKHKAGTKLDIGDDKYIATEPTLDEYISLTKRMAQPIYSFDANTLVHLADIDIDYPIVMADDNKGKLKLTEHPKHFFEAGTGNGSLTLSICRAIHAANGLADHYGDDSLRGAILHSIDRNKLHSSMGRTNVKNYKRGRYIKDVDFYVSETPSSWLKECSTLQQNQQEFLSGVFLDLPNPELYLNDIAKHMKLEATLVVFCPSVTQILECKKVIETSRRESKEDDSGKSLIGLTLTQTIELPPGNGGGTREWDVKTVFAREADNVSICRPKVGIKVVGGGFVGVFKKASVHGDVLNT